MPSSAIIDVAIGIAFVYLFLSLICSVVNEGFATIFSLRAKNLVHGINSLFSESTLADGRAFVEAIYAHGLVRGLYKDPKAVDEKNPLGTSVNAKGTIAASGEAITPQDIVHAPIANLQHMVDDLLAENLRFPSVLTLVKKVRVNLPAYIPAGTFSTALIDIVAPPDPSRARVLADVRDGIALLPPSPTKQALLSLVAETQKDVFEFQEKVEAWFNDSMDRASSWYKRRTQLILLGIGLVVTLALNVDTVKLAQSLWSDPIERQAMVDVAQKYVTEHKTVDPVQRTSAPVTSAHEDAATSASPDQTSPASSLQAQMKELSGVGRQLPFPLGWQAWPPRNPGYWITSLAGWLITTLALSLGAPFWFDTLNKFMSLRSAVKPPERRRSE